MNSELQIFKNEEFGEVRTIEENGKMLFCGKDIAKALGYQRTADAITAHCKGVCVLPTPSNGGVQRMKFISEGDVYRLITHSKLPSAGRFEKWVFDEVIPSIRKHGGYMLGQEEMDDKELLARAVLMSQNMIEERNKIIENQKRKIDEQRPFVEFAMHVSKSDDTIDMEEMSKIARDGNIDIGRNRLIKWLKDNRVLRRKNNMPYQKYINQGLFDVVEATKDTSAGTRVFLKCVITGKGQVWIISKLRNEYCSEVVSA